MTDKNEAMFHLGSILSFFAELHPDYRCRAFDEALVFYNRANPDEQVQPVEGYELHLVQYGPLDRALGHSLGRVALQTIKTKKE